MKNIRLEPVIPVDVRPLPAERTAPELRVLAHVMERGYRQQVVGRVSDLPATLAWLGAQADALNLDASNLGVSH